MDTMTDIVLGYCFRELKCRKVIGLIVKALKYNCLCSGSCFGDVFLKELFSRF